MADHSRLPGELNCRARTRLSAQHLQGTDIPTETGARIGAAGQNFRNSLLISLLAAKLVSETSAIRGGSSASRRGLIRVTPCTLRRGDISEVSGQASGL